LVFSMLRSQKNMQHNTKQFQWLSNTAGGSPQHARDMKVALLTEPRVSASKIQPNRDALGQLRFSVEHVQQILYINSS